MDNLDQFYAALVYIWSEVVLQYKHIIMGVVITMTISALKAARDNSKQNWGEHILCGILCGITCSGLTIITWLIQTIINVPDGMEIPAVFVVGTMSAYIGMVGSRVFIDKIKRRLGLEDDNDSNEG